ncbi:helix-turn-helix domain-containing protein [Pseudoduganella violaceinigra]|uniref:helix-turn-helix domain-containing protein n=1 Tax=Pseudoduganella violaceinigra TaxID=246602 RepID=UPI001E525EBC|nr:helix-turn-helix domain-containing protein [Pseudoduganella violaceinigra]
MRSTIGCELPDEQRLNRYPASAFPTLFLQLAGQSVMVEPWRPEMVCPEGGVLLSGIQQGPTASVNPGPAHFMMVLFFPDALHRLTGIDMNGLAGQFLPIDALLGAEWRELAAGMLAAASDEARVALLEEFLEPRWQAVRQGGPFDGAAGDWVRRLGAQAAAAGIGRSARMAERRIREWAGQPLRRLRRAYRAEQSFLAARDEALKGKISLGDVAQRGGYSDQAHMSREAREISGLSPTEILRRGLEDETYWIYRIWN